MNFGILKGLARARALAVTALLLSLVCSSCGDEHVVAIGGGPIGAEFPSGTPGDEPYDQLREIVVLHDLSHPLQLVVTQEMQLRAKVVDYGLGGPAEGVNVGFDIIEMSADGDATLSASSASTDANGDVEVTFRANFAMDVHYVVELTCDGAEAVQIPIFVTDTPRGDLQVELAYEGPINIKNVHVRLFPGSYTCGQFNPTNVPTEVLGEKTLLGLGLGEVVEWQDLAENVKYTVVATAQSPKGSLGAAGCIDGVVVLAGQTNKVTLTLYLLTLNPAGTYDAENIFDFTGAIPGEVGNLVDQIVLLFNDPGMFLIIQVKDLVANWIPEWVVDAAFSLFEDELADVITDWMLNQSPDWLQDIFVIGQDLTQVVNNLEMLADLHLSKLNNDYWIQGVLYWDGIVLYWHYGCPDEGAPDFDPECGKYTYSIEQFTNTEFPQDIIEGKFTGIIQDFDQFDIDNHVIKLNYGKLIIFVLNELLLPALSGQNNLTDAILTFVNCAAIADALSNDILTAIGATESDIEGFCISSITFIVSPVELLLGALALDSQLRLTGHATLVDDNDNLIVDRIIDGIYLGHVEVDGQEGPEFDGVWQAVRTDPLE